jgi:hypothetical protein
MRQIVGMSDESRVLAWCVVANVAPEVACGEGGLDVRRGLPHFAPNAKVWVLPPQWGDGGEKIPVVGIHRGSRRYVRIVIHRTHLVNFRVGGVYSPAVYRELTRPDREQRGPMIWPSKEEAEHAAARLNQPELPAAFDDTPFGASVPDPPPMTFVHRDRQYFLAHFNANRAWYSHRTPPQELPRD